ncbi:MAG TPA: cell division protein FtsL [Ignavibacteria bacterium]|nr:cell division protein FtsL [Ignavibacteria bacterium]
MEETGKKKVSILYVLISFILLAVVMLIYINNIIYVNRVSAESMKLREDIDKVKNTNDFLRTEIEKLTSFERINTLAKEKFNMRYSDSAIIRDEVIKISN